MRITSLVENTTRRADMQTEHGLSLFVETASHTFLFDMGQSDAFSKNAQKLGIDISLAEFAVLSHGHYDHGGGLREFFKLNGTAPVYANENAFLPHYNGTEKYIGLDASLASHPRIVHTADEHRIDASLSLFSCNQAARRYALDSGGLTEKTDGGFVADDFRHEQYLLVEENGKRILLSGCSHKGILDIVRWFEPDVLIGGFHFSKKPLDERLCHTAKQLSEYQTEFYTCHCTGSVQFEFMKEYMPRLHYLSCGQTIEI